MLFAFESRANFFNWLGDFFKNLNSTTKPINKSGEEIPTVGLTDGSPFSGTIDPFIRPCPASRPESFTRLREEEQLYAAEGYDVIQSQLITTGIIESNPDINFTHKLTMDTIRVEVAGEGQGFTETQVMERMQKAAEIFKQCGVALTEYKLTSVHPLQSNGSDVVDIPILSSQQNMYTSRLPRRTRPAMFFVNDTNENNAGYATFGLGSSNNTSFISTKVLNETRVERIGNQVRTTYGHPSTDPRLNYSTVAHELYHLFCRCGHVSGSEPNLMNNSPNYNTRAGILTPSQCDRMKRSPLIKSI